MICNNLVINSRCTSMQSAGRSSYSEADAIVLVALRNSVDQYDQLTNTPLLRYYPTSYPKSVHYVISTDGIIYQYVEDQNTAWGIDSLHNSTWPGLYPLDDPASQFLFIGVEGDGNLTNAGMAALAKLLCCLATAHNLQINDMTVIVARDLNDEIVYPWSLPQNIIALAQSECLNTGGSGSIIPCCAQNATDIAALQSHIDELNTQICAITAENGPIATMQAAITSLQSGYNELQSRILVLEAVQSGSAQQYAQLVQVIAQHQICIDNMCPTENHTANIEYYGTGLPFTALTPNWLNMGVKVSDTVPSSVMLGPMWTATLETPATYFVEARVRFAVGDWCVGKQAWLDLVVNDGAIRLHTVTVSVGGIQTIELSGSITLSVPPVAYAHLSVQTNDSSMLSRMIDLAWIKITRIGS